MTLEEENEKLKERLQRVRQQRDELAGQLALIQRDYKLVAHEEPTEGQMAGITPNPWFLH